MSEVVWGVVVPNALEDGEGGGVSDARCVLALCDALFPLVVLGVRLCCGGRETPHRVASCFESACAAGATRVCSVVARRHALQKHNAVSGLCSAAEFGSLEVAVWLHSTFGLTTHDARQSNSEALYAACANGHLEFAKWLTVTFGLSREDVLCARSCALVDSCRHGHADLVKWLISNFRLRADDVLFDSWSLGDPFSLSVRSGNFGLSRWLLETLDVRKDDPMLREMWSVVIAAAYSVGDPELIEWALALVPERPPVEETFWCACKSGRLDCLQTLWEHLLPAERKQISLPYCLSACTQNLEMAKFLARVLPPSSKTHGFGQPDFGHVALSRACESGCSDFVRWFLGEDGPFADQTASFERKAIGYILSSLDNGDFPLAEWLLSRFPTAQSAGDMADLFFDVGGRLPLPSLQWLWDHFEIEKHVSSDGTKSLWATCLGHQDLEVSKWLVKRVGLPKLRGKSGELKPLVLEALNGSLPWVRWLVTSCGITAQDICSRDGQALVLSIRSNLDVADWLVARFGLKLEDALRLKLLERCLSSSVTTIEWIINTFRLEKENVRAQCGEVLIDAARSERTDVVEWLATTQGLVLEEFRESVGRALQICCEEDNVNVASWLVDAFGLSGDFVRSGSFLETAVRKKSPGMLEMLCARFSLTLADFPWLGAGHSEECALKPDDDHFIHWVKGRFHRDPEPATTHLAQGGDE